MKEETLKPAEVFTVAVSALALACGALAVSETFEADEGRATPGHVELEAYIPEEIEIPALPFAGMVPKHK